MTIRLLAEEVASRIAAGEVVERPASVVKELVENSLDAGAASVTVETRGGGREMIRVQDNGAGIPAAEVELAFRRHATSKLETANDLEHIATLGFRGEALASIASVSRVTCTSRCADEKMGTQVRVEGGSIVWRAAVGRPQGTELLVEDLFYNVPARRKFLQAERTERNHIDAFLTRYALAYPCIAFSLVHDGREILSTSGSGNAQEALLNVYGMDLGISLLPIPASLTNAQAVQVGGFVSPPSVHRANRGYITLFVNGRWVQDLRLTYAIIQAYHTLLPTKRFPVAFVTVTMPAEDVDVNVHPAKTEVRFRDGDAVFRAVQRAVRATVMDEAPAATAWQMPTSQPAEDISPSDRITRARLAGLTPLARQIALPSAEPPAATMSAAPPVLPNLPLTTPESVLPPAEPRSAALSTLPPLRVIGQASTMVIIAEGPDGIYLIDQHAAHERVLYERMVSAWLQGKIASQPLLEAETVSLPVAEAAYLEELLPALHTLGFSVEPFGAGTFLVRALPTLLTHLAPGDLLADIAAGADEQSPIHTELEERLIRRICKRAAVKAGQVLSREEMERLVRDLEQTANPRTCPHGRPTIIQISVEQLIRQFGRSG
ncbi:MAG TPA: DNA mismatch repair endonuclease MutL [Anaerolineae bacterium]|nr:DNA mismatch repair endonuclease MutL [Anaerolineae bacterium]HQH37618.1 DNA mismatch repair endonuclease MutL [Anaerolineae bacterium]